MNKGVDLSCGTTKEK